MELLHENELSIIDTESGPVHLIDIDECPICLERMNYNEKNSYERHDLYETTCCNQNFHEKCYTDWNSIMRNCPLCRERTCKNKVEEDVMNGESNANIFTPELFNIEYRRNENQHFIYDNTISVWCIHASICTGSIMLILIVLALLALCVFSY
jgi:hypothetical protein